MGTGSKILLYVFAAAVAVLVGYFVRRTPTDNTTIGKPTMASWIVFGILILILSRQQWMQTALDEVGDLFARAGGALWSEVSKPTDPTTLDPRDFVKWDADKKSVIRRLDKYLPDGWSVACAHGAAKKILVNPEPIPDAETPSVYFLPDKERWPDKKPSPPREFPRP